MKKNSIKDTLDEVRGGCITKALAMVTALGKCLAAHTLELDRFQAELWHQGNTLPKYKNRGHKQFLTEDEYMECYLARAMSVGQVVRKRNLSLFAPHLLTPQEYYGTSLNGLNPKMHCPLYAPDYEDFQKLIYLDSRLKSFNQQVAADFKQAFGKITVPRRIKLQCRAEPVSHAAVTRVLVGDTCVSVIPWEMLHGMGEVELYNEVIRACKHSPHLETTLVKIGKRLAPEEDNGYWASIS